MENTSNDTCKFPNDIWKLLKESGSKLIDFAYFTGVSIVQVRNWANGKNFPRDPGTMIKIQTFFGKPMQEIYHQFHDAFSEIEVDNHEES
jgi:transcriptional regulator with XRE-family HTH domain